MDKFLRDFKKSLDKDVSFNTSLDAMNFPVKSRYSFK